MRSYFLSSLIGRVIYDKDFLVFGYIKDLISTNEQRPRIIAAVVIQKNKINNVLFDLIEINKQSNNIIFKHSKDELTVVNSIKIPENAIYLKKHILDKQIVDIEGKKIVRVNDLRLTEVDSGIYLIAVDVGFSGLLRRLSIEGFFKSFFSLFKQSLSSRYILWSDVEALVAPLDKLTLKSSSKLSTMHPSELADIIESLDIKTGAAIMSAFEKAKAADILEELNIKHQSNIIKHLPLKESIDLLDNMPFDEAAYILDDLSYIESQEILKNMKPETSEAIKELMSYEEDTAGSFMSKEFIALSPDMTVSEALKIIRGKVLDTVEILWSIHLVNPSNQLNANISIKDLLASTPTKKLSELADYKVVYLYAKDDKKKIMPLMVKYHLISIPIVDDNNVLVGSIYLHDIVSELFDSGYIN